MKPAITREFGDTQTSAMSALGLGSTVPAATSARVRPSWVWLPLAFFFLLLGVAVGFLIAAAAGQHMPSPFHKPDALSMRLSVEPVGSNLHVRWDRSAVPVRTATAATLMIDDSGARQTVPLSRDQLRNGIVVYRFNTTEVRVRLEVRVSDRVTLVETAQYTGD